MIQRKRPQQCKIVIFGYAHQKHCQHELQSKNTIGNAKEKERKGKEQRITIPKSNLTHQEGKLKTIHDTSKPLD